MSLFYKEEHTTCYNYRMPSTANFKMLSFSAGEEIINMDVDRSVLVFMLQGETDVDYEPYKDVHHRAGHFILFPRGCKFSFKVVEDCVAVSCAFVQGLQLCNRFSFEKLIGYIPENYTYEFHSLPIRERVQEFLDLSLHCLTDGLGCTHFHELLEGELFIFLRAYYSKEELAKFFYPLLSQDIDFRDFILGNYASSFDSTILAEKLNISLKTFNRRFESAFGISAHQWMNQKKAEFVYRDLTLTDKTVAEIAIEYNFSSPNYLVAFCKKALGKTPLDIRKQAAPKKSEK